jgi:hypothetical protein
MDAKRRFLWIAAAAGFGALLVAGDARADGPIARRKARQQARIAQGIRSGQLTASETARIERREAGVNREVREMREDNGGRLTPRERRKIRRQQDRLSREIYREKHDGEHR